MSAQFDMKRLKTHLLLDNPFFGTLAYHLNDVEDSTIETLQTNGVVLKYNPTYLASLSHSEQLAVVAHEVLHPALLHTYRRAERDSREWNEACDYVINAELIAAGFTLPAGVLIDAQYDGMSAEQVFSKRRAQQQPPQPKAEPEETPDEQPDEEKGDDAQSDDDQAGDDQSDDDQQGESSEDSSASDEAGSEGGEGDEAGDDAQQGGEALSGGSMPGCPTGEFVDGPETASAESDLTEADWQVITAEAALVASRAGDLPGGVARALKETREPQVDWLAETRAWLTNTIASDVSWSRPNRRFVSRGLYLPGTIKENVGALVVAIDSSGSTWPMLDDFGSEVSGLLRDARPEKLYVIYCDTRVNCVEEYSVDDGEITLTAKGGGGTLFQPVFDYVEDNAIDPLALVYLTDLDGPTPVEPPYPVLWVTPTYTRNVAPFGDHVRMP